jgi:hypothetical protein
MDPDHAARSTASQDEAMERSGSSANPRWDESTLAVIGLWSISAQFVQFLTYDRLTNGIPGDNHLR